MAGTRITQKAQYNLIQQIANLQSYQSESNGNQSETYIFINITVTGAGSTGQIIFNSDLNGNPTGSSVIMTSRSGGGINFLNAQNAIIASLDSKGNLKCKGTITHNTSP